MQFTRYAADTEEQQEETSPNGRSSTKQLELMQKNRGLRSRSETDRQPFATIDSALEKAQELALILTKLTEYKHPLDVRKGSVVREKQGKEVEDDMVDQNDSKVVKAGSKTYFFDMEETREGKPYLKIAESRFKGEGKERERSTIIVFPENAQEFADAVSVMIDRLS